MEVDNKRIGSIIRDIRLSKGWTLEEFGEKLNTSKVTVFNWEKGRNKPNKENLRKIADIGNMSVNELLYGNPEKFVEKVLIEDIKNQGKYYQRLIDYLSLKDNLYEVVDAIESTNSTDKEIKLLREKTIQNKAVSYTKENLKEIIDHLENFVYEDIFDKEFVIDGAAYHFEEIGGVERTVEFFYREFKDIIEIYNRSESDVNIEDVTKMKDFLKENSSYSEEEAWTGAIENVFLSKMLKEANKSFEEIENLYKEYKYIQGED